MTDLERRFLALERMTTDELSERYMQLTGQPCRSRHREYLVRKVAWRMQAVAEGDLTERARRRAAELADDADVRLMPPKASIPEAPPNPRVTAMTPPRAANGATRATDPRLPSPGTAISREYKGRTLRVVVLPDGGFEFEGQRYRTLTAIAEAVTGSHINGFRFFQLKGNA